MKALALATIALVSCSSAQYEKTSSYPSNTYEGSNNTSLDEQIKEVSQNIVKGLDKVGCNNISVLGEGVTFAVDVKYDKGGFVGVGYTTIPGGKYPGVTHRFVDLKPLGSLDGVYTFGKRITNLERFFTSHGQQIRPRAYQVIWQEKDVSRKGVKLFFYKYLTTIDQAIQDGKIELSIECILRDSR